MNAPHGVALLAAAACLAAPAAAQPDLGPEQLVQAGGADLSVPGYSVPSLAHWNDDGLLDLVVGHGSGTADVKVRVYLNSGSPEAPAFGGFAYAQSNGTDLTAPGGG